MFDVLAKCVKCKSTLFSPALFLAGLCYNCMLLLTISFSVYPCIQVHYQSQEKYIHVSVHLFCLSLCKPSSKYCSQVFFSSRGFSMTTYFNAAILTGYMISGERERVKIWR